MSNPLNSPTLYAESIGPFTCSLLQNNTVVCKNGGELRYIKKHSVYESAIADYDGLCAHISAKTGHARPLPAAPDFIATINT